MSKREINAVCPYDCPDACGLVLTVENNTVLSVRAIRIMRLRAVLYALKWCIMKIQFTRRNACGHR